MGRSPSIVRADRITNRPADPTCRRRRRRGQRPLRLGSTDLGHTDLPVRATLGPACRRRVCSAITEVRSAARARSNAASSSSMVVTVSAWQPMAAAWAAKSTRTSFDDRWQSSIRLLNGTPPWLICSRLITAKPPLSQTITIILWPGQHRAVEVAVHHQVRAVADEDDDLRSGIAILAPQPPAIS